MTALTTTERTTQVQTGGDGVPHLRERLRWLMDNIPAQAGERMTAKVLAGYVTARGTPVTAGHIANLASGVRDNPSAQLLANIAAVCAVPVTYFFDDQIQAEIQRAVLRLTDLRRDALDQLSRDVAQLDQRDFHDVLQILDRVESRGQDA